MRFILSMIMSVLPLILAADIQPGLPEGPLPVIIKAPGDEGLKIQLVTSSATHPATSIIIVAASLGSIPDMKTSSVTVAEYTVLAEKTLRSTSMELFFYSQPTEVSSTQAFPILVTTFNTQTASCVHVLPTYNLQAAQRSHVVNQVLTEKVLKQTTILPEPVAHCPTKPEAEGYSYAPLNPSVMEVVEIVPANPPMREIELDVIGIDFDNIAARKLKLGKKCNGPLRKKSCKPNTAASNEFNRPYQYEKNNKVGGTIPFKSSVYHTERDIPKKSAENGKTFTRIGRHEERRNVDSDSS
jgi:hypothetical protein